MSATCSFQSPVSVGEAGVAVNTAIECDVEIDATVTFGQCSIIKLQFFIHKHISTTLLLFPTEFIFDSFNFGVGVIVSFLALVNKIYDSGGPKLVHFLFWKFLNTIDVKGNFSMSRAVGGHTFLVYL